MHLNVPEVIHSDEPQWVYCPAPDTRAQVRSHVLLMLGALALVFVAFMVSSFLHTATERYAAPACAPRFDVCE